MAKAESSPSSSQTASERAKAWEPGSHTFPWLPFIVTIVLVLFCGAVVVVLAVSNGDRVDSWQIQPSVLLSLAASGLGFCTAFIYGEGARIGWWLFLIRGGTLGEVHERWEIASSPSKAALYPLKRWTVNRVVIGCLGSTAMFATGTFLQRASTVVSGTQVQNINISIPVAPELPYPFSSIYTGRTVKNDYLTTIFAQTLQQFQARLPIPAPNSTCDGSCVASVPGAGFVVSCDNTTYNWTFSIDANGDFSTKTGLQIGFNYTYDYSFDDGEPVLFNPAITVDILYKTLPVTANYYTYQVNSTTNFSTLVIGVERHCTLRPATVLYPVLVTANTITNGSNTTSTSGQSSNNISNTTNDNVVALLGDMSTDHVIEVFNHTFDSYEYTTVGSTYLAYVDTISELYSADIEIGWTGAKGYQIRRNTSSSPFGLYYIQGALTFGAALGANTDLLLNTTFRDPTADILSALRELMFRMSVAAAADPTAAGVWAVEGFNTTNGPLYNLTTLINGGIVTPIVPSPDYFSADGSLQAVQTTLITVYKTEYLYVALALAWVLLVVACITPSYWGFWHLGRQVSLSPLEIARAFEAPLLSGVEGSCGSNETLDGIIDRVGTKRVRYGEVIIPQGDGKEKELDQKQTEVPRQNGAKKTARVSVHSMSNSSSNVNSSSNPIASSNTTETAHTEESPAAAASESHEANTKITNNATDEADVNVTEADPHETNINTTNATAHEINGHSTEPESEPESEPEPLHEANTHSTEPSPTAAPSTEPATAATSASTALSSSTELTSRRPWLAVADFESVVTPRPGVLYD